eukprot:232251_1
MTENIKRSRMRWVFGITICSSGMCYGINRYVLVPIQDQLIDHYSIDPIGYNLLMTLYSWPNVFFSMCCGVLVDLFGVRKILLLSWILAFIGLSCISYSSIIEHYILLCIGRTIVGIGNEGISMTVKLYAIEFFPTHEYASVFAIYLAFVSFGGGLNVFISYRIYEWFNINYSMAFPLALAPFIFTPLCAVMFIEKAYYKKKMNKITDQEYNQLVTPKTHVENDNKFSLWDIKLFSKYFWILLAAFVVWCGSIQSSLNIGISFLHHMFGYSYSFATTIATIGTGIQVIAYLLGGKITTVFGRKCEMLLFASICSFIAGYIYGWVNNHIFWAFFGQFMFSISLGFTYPVVWASIPLLVIDRIKGTAFGFATAIRFFTIGICYVGVGFLTNEEDGNTKYIDVQIFVLGLIAISTMIYLLLYYMDNKYNNGCLRKVHRRKPTLIPAETKTVADMSMGKLSFVDDNASPKSLVPD